MAGIRSMSNKLTLIGEGSEQDKIIGNIFSMGEISTEADEIDVTTLDSPNGAKEFIQGAKDSGEFAVELNNVADGTVEDLNSVFDSGDTREWEISFTDNDLTTEVATLEFDAFIKSRAYGEQTTDGLNKVTFTLRISGSPVYTEV